MYRHYARGDAGWPEGARRAKAFIAGPLRHHLATWPRHGRLGVPEHLDAAALCGLLPSLLEEHGEFGLLMGLDAPRLLLVPVRDADAPSVLCYGPWPGIDMWEAAVEPALPDDISLLQTCWNAMPWRHGTRLAAPLPRLPQVARAAPPR
jgi:hypothetical protein